MYGKVRLVALASLILAARSVCLAGSEAAHYDPTQIMYDLSRISMWTRAHAPLRALGLWPPAGRPQIEALAAERGVKVPEEVYKLYDWHNGSTQALFGEYRFLPVAEAFSYGDALHKLHPGEAYKLPLFRSNLSLAAYTVECLPRERVQTRVQFLDNGSYTKTETLTDFITALAQSFENGAFEANDVNQDIFERFLLNHDPPRKNAVEMVLLDLPYRLSPEQEMAAYTDLLATQDPRAEKLIALAAERWSMDEQYSFSTMELLARLDTASAFDTLQKLMRDNNPAIRKRAYAMLAFYWPDDGRQLDKATELAAIRDLGNAREMECGTDSSFGCRVLRAAAFVRSDPFSNLDKRFVLRVLRRSPDAQPVPAVVYALANPQTETRMAAAETLGFLADQRAVAPLLVEAATDSDQEVREACYHALADLGNATGEQRLWAEMAKADPFTLDHALQNGSPAAKWLARRALEASGQ
jgi:hypothetical protein